MLAGALAYKKTFQVEVIIFHKINVKKQFNIQILKGTSFYIIHLIILRINKGNVDCNTSFMNIQIEKRKQLSFSSSILKNLNMKDFNAAIGGGRVGLKPSSGS